MKEVIWEYLPSTASEKKAIWNDPDTIFVFDTNVLLDYYRYTKSTADTFLKNLTLLKDKLWLPHQIASEFAKNRYEVIYSVPKTYKGVKDSIDGFIKSTGAALRMQDSDTDLKSLKEYMEKWIDRVSKENLRVTNHNEDHYLDAVLLLFDGKVGQAYSKPDIDKHKKDGKQRFAELTPPGYCDAKKQKESAENNSYGDYIIWRQMMDFSISSKKNIVFVTRDQKEDWWNIQCGKTIGPRSELKREFADTTQRSFAMYSIVEFTKFSAIESGVPASKDVIEEMRTISAENAPLKITLWAEDFANHMSETDLQRTIAYNSEKQRYFDGLKSQGLSKALIARKMATFDHHWEKSYYTREPRLRSPIQPVATKYISYLKSENDSCEKNASTPIYTVMDSSPE